LTTASWIEADLAAAAISAILILIDYLLLTIYYLFAEL